MNKFIIYFTTILILSGCSGSSQKDEIAKVVKEWQGKTITLPEKVVDFISGDTINISEADFTILTYVDSTGCTGCKMKLPLWEEFLNSIDSITDAEFLPLMVVNSNNKNELKYLFDRDLFEYPVYVDSEDNINKQNSFPDNIIFQTFLLDKNRKVVAIGNPTHSTSIAKLYKSILSGKQIFSTNVNSMIKLNENKVDLGCLKSGNVRSRKLILTNAGNDTVFIRKIITSCDCTSAKITQGYIPPNGEASINVYFTADSIKGNFIRSVNIYYKGFDYPSTIQITGVIK